MDPGHVIAGTIMLVGLVTIAAVILVEQYRTGALVEQEHVELDITALHEAVSTPKDTTPIEAMRLPERTE